MRLRSSLLAAALCALAGCAASDSSTADGDWTSESGGDTRPRGARRFDRALAASYDAGLDFLRSQRKSGSWQSPDGAPSVELTALAVAALFDRPGGLRDADRDAARRGVEFVMSRVDDDGLVRDAAAPTYAAGVVIACLAASGRDDARALAERCASRLRSFQARDRSDTRSFGGMGYGPGTAGRESDDGGGTATRRAGSPSRADLSNTTYALEGLRAAGVPPDDRVFQDALVFVERTQTFDATEFRPPSETDARDDGGASYRPGRGRTSTGSMTASLLRCYQLCGVSPASPRVQAAHSWLARNFTLEANPGMAQDASKAGLFALYAALARALRGTRLDTLATPRGDVDWRQAIVEHLRATQRDDGSWVNSDPSWREGEPLVATTYALRALADCYVKSVNGFQATSQR